MKSVKDLIANISGGESAAHAYIVEGGAGSVRDDFVMTLISGLECKAPGVHDRPCGICDACIQAAAFTNPDVVYMQRSGKSGYRSEDAVAFTERLCMRPYGRYLIGIINDAETLSEIVQNKLLKTLEEPLDNVILLLVTSRSDELLSTVRSRCSLIRIAEYEGYEGGSEAAASEEMAEGITMLISDGSEFWKFREFLDKNIKTNEDAAAFIGYAEERLHDMMMDGIAVGECASMIEAAEKTAMDIGRGMDRSRALKKLFLELRG